MSEHDEAIKEAKWVLKMGGGGIIIPLLAAAVIDMAEEIEGMKQGNKALAESRGRVMPEPSKRAMQLLFNEGSLTGRDAQRALQLLYDCGWNAAIEEASALSPEDIPILDLKRPDRKPPPMPDHEIIHGDCIESRARIAAAPSGEGEA